MGVAEAVSTRQTRIFSNRLAPYGRRGRRSTGNDRPTEANQGDETMAEPAKAAEQQIGEFDVTPSPRVLPMLGEINIDQWRCIAELVDNSVDGFLNESRSGTDVSDAKVDVHLPTSDSEAAILRVIDNGPGMTPDQLENAVSAGWSGNSPIDNLGLFGMGFNIATARLGSVTEVWTTRRGETQSHGLEIDFDKLRQQKHFRIAHKVRSKLDSEQHGTEIILKNLKPEQRKWLTSSANRAKVRNKLAQAYSSMLGEIGKPIGFGLYLNQRRIEPQRHCVWDELRTGFIQRGETVNAVIHINNPLPKRPYCINCMNWLTNSMEKDSCPICGSEESLVTRDRRVFGWIGIQRYLHEKDFGIDYIRNGRKIEIGNKDIFSWTDEEREIEDIEYPIDDLRNRGRIVGEVHIDHCRVNYSKDRFDRADPSWKEMTQIVRGAGPLRPEKARDFGYDINTSPLGLLFSAFRRSNPKSKTAGGYCRLLVVKDNDAAIVMAKSFRNGTSEYQDDTKWWKLAEEADAASLYPQGSGASGTSHSGTNQLPSGLVDDMAGDTNTDTPQETDSPDSPDNAFVPERIEFSSLDKIYHDDQTGTRWDVKAFEVESNDPELKDGAPWALVMADVSTKTHHFLFDPTHSIFQSITMTPRDALLAHLSFLATDQMRRTDGNVDFSKVLSGFRDSHCREEALDLRSLPMDALSVLSDVARGIVASCPDDQKSSLFNDLSIDEQTKVMRALASKGTRQPTVATSDGSFLPLSPCEILQSVVEKKPELCFDGNIWSEPYADIDYKDPEITQEARESLLSYYLALISDAVWLSKQEVDSLSNIHRIKIVRAVMSIQLLRPDVEISI